MFAMKFFTLLFALLLLCPLAYAQVSSNGDTTIVESAAYISPAKTKTGKVRINVAVIAENPYADKFASYPTIQVTARAADGSVIDTKEFHTAGIPPKGRIAFAAPVFTEERPTKVEIRPLSAQYEPTVYKPTEFRPFKLLNVSRSEGPDGGFRITGQLENPYPKETKAYVTLLFRDAAGKLLSGRSKWIQKVNAAEPTPFELEVDADDIPPGTKNVERYAISSINFQNNLPEVLGH
jgi:hypothetical protein